jgi:glutathione S-transferase
MALTLVIGNKNYSSWSLRPWLALAHHKIPFEEVIIPIHTPETPAAIAKYSPAGKVPVLIDGEAVVWESIAILEHLAERFPDAKLWPADLAARAHARAISSEMHSGFSALRQHCPMNLKRKKARRSRPKWMPMCGALRRCGATPGAFRRGRRLPVRRILGGRLHVCAGGDSFRQLRDRRRSGECRLYVEAIYALPAFKEWQKAQRSKNKRVGPRDDRRGAVKKIILPGILALALGVAAGS